jgi:brefeldin A-inhibited guanine nucleotide-exchange protein
MAEDIEAQKQQERVAHEAVQIASNGVDEVEGVVGSPSKPAFEEVDINGGEVEQERSGEVKQETPVSGTDKPLPSPSTQVLLSPPSGKATEEMQDVPLASSAPTPEPPSPAAHPPATPAKDHAVPRASQSVTSLQHFDSRPTTPGRTGSAVGGHTRQSSTHTLSLSTRPSTSSGPQLSSVLIIPGLQTIAHSKEAKRSPALLQAATRALELCQNNAAFAHPREIFEPLRLACETRVEKLVIPSLDLLSKLIAHSFFQEPNGPPPNEPPIADLIAHSITICYVESSPAPVALQVIKALLALVLSPAILVHQSSLLKAVRTIYNIFLLSPDATNQMVAQGGLTQMVQHVFGRVPRGKNATRPSSAMDANASEVGSEQHSVSPSQARRSSAKTDRGSVSSPAPVAEDHAVNGGEGQVDSSDSGTKPEDADGHAPPTAAKENAVDAASDAHSKDRLTL